MEAHKNGSRTVPILLALCMGWLVALPLNEAPARQPSAPGPEARMRLPGNLKTYAGQVARLDRDADVYLVMGSDLCLVTPETVVTDQRGERGRLSDLRFPLRLLVTHAEIEEARPVCLEVRVP